MQPMQNSPELLPSDSSAAVHEIEQTVQQAMQLAGTHHRAGRLADAESLYRAILELQSGHAAANHGLGLIAIETRQITAALPFFEAALQAMPGEAGYWLSYIDSLVQANEPTAAREVLALGRQHGLAGEQVDQLAAVIEAAQQADEKEPGAAAMAHLPAQAESAAKPAPRKNSARHPTGQEIQQLTTLYNQANFERLESFAREMTLSYPGYVLAWKMLGDMFYRQGRMNEALESMQQVAELSPRDVEAHSNLGVALQAVGRLDEAEASLRRAIKCKPGYAEAHSNLGIVLQAKARLSEAEASLRRAVAIKPNLVGAHYNLGITLKAQGKPEEAKASLRRALALDPSYAEAYNNMGIILHEQGKAAEAEASLRKALAINTGFAEVHNNLGLSLQAQGRIAEAEACLREALQINPTYADGYNNLGALLKDEGRLVEAEACLQQALAFKPDFAGACNNLALVMNAQGKPDAAQAWLARAVELEPGFAEGHNNMGFILQDQGRLAEAEAWIHRALALKADYAEAHSNLGVVLQRQSRLDEAIASLRRALALNPDYADAHSNLLFCLSEVGGMAANELFAEHRRFAERFEAPHRQAWPVHANTRDPHRQLEVGFVSGDFRNHALSVFIEPILKYLCARPGISLHAYYNHAICDNVTDRLRTYFKHWNAVPGMSDASLASKIAADRIDILVDLSGHTAYNRMLTFARKPAPLQATWIGYPGTTGLEAMDYFLTDRYLLPQEEFGPQFVEKFAYLPCAAPFAPSSDAPPVNSLPALANGYLTFGSFNRPSKITREVVAVWGRLLRRLPDSRLLVGAMPKDGRNEAVLQWLLEEGVAMDRITLHPRSDMSAYLSLHHQIDVCLDTFPYAGGTTTLNALWMGVPTLTLAGETVASRTGAAILGHLGLEDFIAADSDEFMRKGLHLAENGYAGLAEMRARLRPYFAQSAQSRPDVITDGLEWALRSMWQRWCAGLAAETFDAIVPAAAPTQG